MKITNIDYNNPKTRYKTQKDKQPVVVRKFCEYCRSNGLLGMLVQVPDDTNKIAKAFAYSIGDPKIIERKLEEAEDIVVVIDSYEGKFADGYAQKPPTESIPDVEHIKGEVIVRDYSKK